MKVLAVTGVDLFIPMLSFVFGQAQFGGSAALISLARLQQEFYGIPPNPGLTTTRAVKECIHEVGHTFGLIHCPDPGCPMSLSNNMRQVDVKSDEFCSNCSIILEEHITSLRRERAGRRKGDTSMNTHWQILVVDDEEVMRESLAAWLREDGYIVDTAVSGGDAMEHAGSKEYAIYFIDLKMPGGIDGIETMMEIKSCILTRRSSSSPRMRPSTPRSPR